MRLKAILVTGAVTGLVLAGAALAYAWEVEIPAVTTPNPASFDVKLVDQGRNLALIGDCRTCHTKPGGRVFAGGLAMPTPFGTIYSTNITPDRDTGIGSWSEEAFARAMRRGVDREGRHLYPAFPYDHFALTKDDDIRALYAYFMTREPVSAMAPANELPFPISVRLVLAGWKLLFLRDRHLEHNPAQDEQWHRGRYLVEGLGHCGACHTPRNMMGAEERSEAFEGGEAEGWHAYALGQASKASIPWTAEALETYLASGSHRDHGTALGPMAPVAENLAHVPREDITAIAAYLASLAPQSPATTMADPAPISTAQSAGSQTIASPVQSSTGGRIYDRTCAPCHAAGRAPPLGGVSLGLSTAVSGESPENLLNLILNGIPAASSSGGPIMPGFGAVLSDDQVLALAQFLRTELAKRPDWPTLESNLRQARAARAMSGSK